MKQIFDFMRRRVTENISTGRFGVGLFLDTVNEAEAKWESECCTWKKSEVYGYIKNPHTGRIFSNEPSMQNVYCNTCGKPIKISEVE